MKIKCLTILVVLLCIIAPPITNGYSVKCVRIDPTTASLITMFQPGLDPELAAVHAKYIDKNVKIWGVDRYTFVSMVDIESQFNSMAWNKSGAMGASQVLARVHRDNIKKNYEVFHLDNNYSLGCEILYDAKRESHSLDETLRLYVGGNNPEYNRAVKKGIAKCKAMQGSTLIVSTTDKG
jgi:hypothetical protein